MSWLDDVQVPEREEAEIPSLPTFWDMLDKHDWHYQMSDDHRVWATGEKARARLQDIADRGGPAYQELMDGFKAHVFSGSPWKTEKQPKPERPQEESHE